MSTMQKMISEIRELDANEWDSLGGLGAYGPTQEPTNIITTCTQYNPDGTAYIYVCDHVSD